MHGSASLLIQSQPITFLMLFKMICLHRFTIIKEESIFAPFLEIIGKKPFHLPFMLTVLKQTKTL